MLVLTLIALTIFGPQRQSPPKVQRLDEHAVVTPRRIERSHGKGEDRHTAVFIRPVVSGLRAPVLKKIRKELELEKILRWQYVYYKTHNMFDFEYRVTLNRNHILAIVFSWNAYFADHEKPVVFDLRDGRLITAQDLFRDEQTPELVKVIDHKLQVELEEMVREHDRGSELSPLEDGECAVEIPS